MSEQIKFKVVGAGELILGSQPHAICGNAVGFHLTVSWHNGGKAGGVIGRTEARKLAEFILKECDKVTISEAEEKAQFNIGNHA